MLYRNILRKENLIPFGSRELFIPVLREAVIFNINNIADYIYTIDTRNGWDIKTDFPNLAPPFPAFWMEYKMPNLINTEKGPIKYANKGFSVGILVEAWNADEIRLEFPNPLGTRWGLMMALFIECGPDVAHLSSTMFAIGPDGLPVIKDGKYFCTRAGDEELYERVLKRGFDNPDHELVPALLAISFLHCKNVTMVETGRTKRQYHCKNKNREPETKVYTLEIEPMKKVLKTEGKSEETGLKRALHICRGHFKDFREKGLFGKFKGIYWWDSQVRGNSKYGTIDKDYNVNPPQEG